MSTVVETYINPTLPPNSSWMAHTDEGTYGFGRTPLDAIVDLLNAEQKLESKNENHDQHVV